MIHAVVPPHESVGGKLCLKKIKVTLEAHNASMWCSSNFIERVISEHEEKVACGFNMWNSTLKRLF